MSGDYLFAVSGRYEVEGKSAWLGVTESGELYKVNGVIEALKEVAETRVRWDHSTDVLQWHVEIKPVPPSVPVEDS